MGTIPALSNNPSTFGGIGLDQGQYSTEYPYNTPLCQLSQIMTCDTGQFTIPRSSPMFFGSKRAFPFITYFYDPTYW